MDIGAGERDPEPEEISTGLVPPRPPPSSCTLLLLPLRVSSPISCPWSFLRDASEQEQRRPDRDLPLGNELGELGVRRAYVL